MTTKELQRLNGPLYHECIGLAISLTREKNLAMDLVQEAYYLAHKRHDTFTEGSNLTSWIKTIVYNVFLSDYRKAKRRRKLITTNPPTDNWITGKTTNNSAEAEMEAQDLTVMVEEVPAMYRHCLLRYVNGMSYQQIANAMNLPVGTIKSRVFTARRLLKEQIAKSRPKAA